MKQNGSKSTNHSEEHDLLTPCQRTVKNRNLENGSKPTNHSEERDLLATLNLSSLFPETSATLIDGGKNTTVGGDLYFRFRMLLKSAIRTSFTCF